MSMSPPSILHGPDLDPSSCTTLGDALDSTISRYPMSTLTLFDRSGGSSTVSYSQLRSRARARWSDLLSKGIRAGDVVILLADDVADLLECAWACFLGGAIAAPIAAPIDFMSDDAGLKRLRDALAVLPGAKIAIPPALVGRAALATAAVPPSTIVLNLASLRPDAESDADPAPIEHGTTDALYLLTSGSTGLPKAVPLSHRQIILRSIATQIAMPLDGNDIALNWMPLDHVGGIVMWHLSPLITGCSQVQVPTSYVSAEPMRWFELVDRFRATFIWAPNFAFGLVTERLRSLGGQTWDLSCVTAIVNGGEAVNPNTARQFLAMFAPYGLLRSTMRPMWGMSETASGCILAPRLRDDLVLGKTSVGKPLPGLSLRLTDEHGEIVAQGETGVLEVKGSYVTKRYQAADDAANCAFREDGWFSTGDEGVIVEGELVLVGRASETLIVNGVNHHSQTLEADVEQLEWVRPGHVAVCGVSGPASTTDRVVVFVGSHDDRDITIDQKQQVHTRLMAQFGIGPSHVVGLKASQFPRTGLGKIQRKILAESFKAGEFTDPEEAKSNRVAAPLLVPIWTPRPASGHRQDEWGPWTVEPYQGSQGARDLVARLSAQPGFSRAGAIGADAAASANQIVVIEQPDSDSCVGSLVDALESDSRLLARLDATGGPRRLAILALAGPDAPPAVAARVAYMQNAALEFGHVSVRVVYLDRLDESIDQMLAAELTSSSEPEVLLADGLAHVRRYTPLPVTDFCERSLLVEGGHYIITGSGEVAHALAHFLIDNFGATATLVARTAISGEARGSGLKSVTADVTDADTMTEIIAKANSHKQLSAIFHLANHVQEWPILRMERHILANGLAPKVTGLNTLISVCRTQGIAVPIVAFSSLLSSFFSPLYATYVAANRYLDAAARVHFPAVRSLAWGSWSGLGISRDLIQNQKAHSTGFGAMELDEAFRGLDLALQSSEPVVLIGANPNGARIRPVLTSSPEQFDHTAVAHIMINTPQSNTAPALPVASDAPGLSETEAALIEPLSRIWIDILKVGSVSLEDNFFAKGGDSLALAELHHLLSELVGKDVPIVPLFRARSFREVLQYAATQ